jgi:hypothetical protein
MGVSFGAAMQDQLKAISQEVPKHRLNLRSFAVLQLSDSVERRSLGQSCLYIKRLPFSTSQDRLK